MPQRLQTSRRGLELIKSFEGFRARSFRLPNGDYLIGFGHTKTAEPGQEITRVAAEKLLKTIDLPPIEAEIANAVFSPLSQNEFDALVSLTFNIGIDAFRTSDVVRYLNEGSPLAAAHAITFWRKGRIDGRLNVIDALVRRRAAEHALFLEPPAGQIGLTSALVRAEQDYDSLRGVGHAPAVVIEPRRATAPDNKPKRDGVGEPNVQQDAVDAVRNRLREILGRAEVPETSEAPKNVEIMRGNPERFENIEPEDVGDAVRDLADRLQAQGLGTRPIAAMPAPTNKLPELEDLNEQVELEPEDFDVLAPLDSTSEDARPATQPIIDDLEPFDLDLDLVDGNVGGKPSGFVPAKFGNISAKLGFGALAGAGLLGFLFGAWHFWRTTSSVISSENAVMFGPIFMLVSLILLLIAAYYLIREITD